MDIQAIKGRVEFDKDNLVEIAGNRRNEMLTDAEDDVQMHAGRDRVGFVAIRRNTKKGGKDDRY